MTVAQIKKGDKASYDTFGLRIMSRELNPPSKKKIKKEVPFMHGSYDFSLLNGDQPYTERELTYTFEMKYQDKTEYFDKKIKIIEWLEGSPYERIEDNQIRGYHFLGECDNSIEFVEDFNNDEVTVTFTAYPFKIRDYAEGKIPWDDFCFLTDCLQQTKFTVDGRLNIQMYNHGSAGMYPTIICDSDFRIVKKNMAYNLKAGTIKSYDFRIDKGTNDMTLIGNGTIEFIWYKEVL